MRNSEARLPDQGELSETFHDAVADACLQAGACEPDEFDVFHHDEHGLARTSIGDPDSAASNNVANVSIAL